MQIVSNSMPGAISPWSAWQMLFNPYDGDEAVLITGYLSGGTGSSIWCDDIIGDIVDWLQHPRPTGVLPRRLSIYVGNWNDPGTYARSIDMLGRILANVDPHYRQHVCVNEVPKLHVKAFAVYAGKPGTGSANCIRLMTGSSNLTYSSMAAGNNIELDGYFTVPTDAVTLALYGAALRDVEMQCISPATKDQAPDFSTQQSAGLPVVARRVYSDEPLPGNFYSDIENAMINYEIQLAAQKVKADDDAMHAASNECLQSDVNS